MLQKLKYFIRSKILPNRLFLIDKKYEVKPLYLTFDDGPVPEVTIHLLELLDKYQVKTTFFVIGECAKKHPDVLSLIHQKGHVITNNTYTHPPFHKISMQQKIRKVIDTNHLFKEIINKDCKMFRAPQGRWDMKLLFQLFRLKITVIHWSRDSMDFLKEDPENIIKCCEMQPVNSADILLFHDDHVRCITVLDTLIPLWISQGYTLAALEQN